MRYRLCMKHLTPVILLALAPLSWGEDVYYCVIEHSIGLEATNSGDAYEMKAYDKLRFTFKYEAAQDRLAMKGAWWHSEGKAYFIDCKTCLPSVGTFHTGNDTNLFNLRDGRFHHADSFFHSSSITTGTCEKF